MIDIIPSTPKSISSATIPSSTNIIKTLSNPSNSDIIITEPEMIQKSKCEIGKDDNA